jgi:hypothetical protein
VQIPGKHLSGLTPCYCLRPCTIAHQIYPASRAPFSVRRSSSRFSLFAFRFSPFSLFALFGLFALRLCLLASTCRPCRLAGWLAASRLLVRSKTYNTQSGQHHHRNHPTHTNHRCVCEIRSTALHRHHLNHPVTIAPWSIDSLHSINRTAHKDQRRQRVIFIVARWWQIVSSCLHFLHFLLVQLESLQIKVHPPISLAVRCSTLKDEPFTTFRMWAGPLPVAHP